MKYPLSRKELKIKRKKLLYALICIALVVGAYLYLTREKRPTPDAPTVTVAPAGQQDVEIYGEYVGRIRAQQFVEVRARVEDSSNRCCSRKAPMSPATKCSSSSTSGNTEPKPTRQGRS